MPEEPRPLEHLIRALDELARAGLDAAELISGRSGSAGGGLTHHSILDALRKESERWSSRAPDDPAAAKVHEIFSLLLGILEPPPRPPGDSDGRPPRA